MKRIEPRNAEAVRKRFPTYASRMAATRPVLVTLCGDTGKWRGLTVFADPVRSYDWSVLRRLPLVLIVRKGIDATRVVSELDAMACASYVTLADADTGRSAAVMQLHPKLRLLPLPDSLPEYA